jgi:hypothetical protein
VVPFQSLIQMYWINTWANLGTITRLDIQTVGTFTDLMILICSNLPCSSFSLFLSEIGTLLAGSSTGFTFLSTSNDSLSSNFSCP